MSDVNVRTTLTLDDRASSALNQIKSGFKETAAAEQQAHAGASAFGNMLSTFAAVNLMPAIHSVYNFGKSFLDAAAAGQAADNAVAALIMTAQGSSWARAYDNANALGDSLDEIAINAGVAGDQIEAGFRQLLTLTGATDAGVASAKDQIGKMATIAGVMGMDVSAVATEFGMMGEGILRTRGQLFQLLQTTGIFGDNTKKAAALWAQMTEEQRTKALATGLDQLAGSMGKAEPSLKQMVQSLDTAWEVAKEKLGEPLLRALMPELKRLVEWMKRSRDQVEEFAKAMSGDVSKAVTAAGESIREGFKWIKEHQVEIKDAIVDAWKFAKEVVTFILAHKTELALIYGAKTAAPIAGAAVDVGRGVTSLAASGVPALGIAAGGAGAAGAAAALGAFTLAVAGVGAAAWQAKKLIDEGGLTSEDAKNAAAVAEMFKGMRNDQNTMLREWTKQEIDSFNDRRAAMIKWAQEAGMNTRQIGEVADATWAAHRAARAQVEQFDKMAAVFNNLRQAGVDLSTVDMGPAVEKLSTGFTGAINTHNEAVAVYIANVLVKNKELQAAFLNSTALTGDAMDSLANMIKGKSAELDELAKQLEGAASKDKAKGDKGKPAAPKVSIGSATFKIEQNFRDQDPDRVAIVFERDIARVVENRLQAITTSPFGT